MGAKKTVDDAVLRYPVVVFSKTFCPYCKRGKAAISEANESGVEVKVYELDNMGGTGRSIQKYIRDKYGHGTVPAVFIGGELIGGGDETAALQRAGKLARMISAAVSKQKAGSAPAAD